MNLLLIVLIAAAVLGVAYRVYGSLLARLLKLDDGVATPAVTLRDDVDFAPIEPKFLMSQHFSAIAAAGPIVGPILAGVMFGWLPALLWILAGSILIGGVHDMTALVASIRHKARSIAQIVREHMTKRSYILFLVFIWIALVYIIVAFTDIVGRSFVGEQVLESGQVIRGGATATSSLLYLALPMMMGLLLRCTKLSVNAATVIFLPLVGVAIAAGPMLPLDLASMLGTTPTNAAKVWNVLLLLYCLVAAALPMWLLLQPRGHLGGYFLLVAVAGAAAGIVVSGVRGWITGADDAVRINYPAFVGWEHPVGGPLFPMLFITIACGACSGFHCLIASGTTSKQLSKESQAKIVGYGSMLLEGMVATISLCTVMVLSFEAAKGKTPNLIYALGNAGFLGVLGVPATFAVSFALLAFTTFVYDTLDVCTRLGRYIIEELTGWTGVAGRWFAIVLTGGTPALFVTQTTTNAQGKEVAAWQVFWPLFGASNQLMAALALLGVTVWLWRTRGAWWVWPVVGLPTVVMYTMSSWALLRFVRQGFFDASWKLGGEGGPVPWAAVVLLALAVMVLFEAVRVFLRPDEPRGPDAPLSASTALAS